MGLRLREIRLASRLSLRHVAKEANVSAAFLSDIELGRRFPTDESLAAIARVLNAAPAELKKHDHRSALADLKRIAEATPSLGAAMRRLVDEMQAGKLTAEQLAAKLSRASQDD
jgi:transcriptional regulator with XRE-family HTH domain